MIPISLLYAVPLSDELIVLHHASTAQMNAIASPVKGSLIFNTDDNEVYERNATAWHKVSTNSIAISGSGTLSDSYL